MKKTNQPNARPRGPDLPSPVTCFAFDCHVSSPSALSTIRNKFIHVDHDTASHTGHRCEQAQHKRRSISACRAEKQGTRARGIPQIVNPKSLPSTSCQDPVYCPKSVQKAKQDHQHNVSTLTKIDNFKHRTRQAPTQR